MLNPEHERKTMKSASWGFSAAVLACCTIIWVDRATTAVAALGPTDEIRIVEIQGTVEVFPFGATTWTLAKTNQFLEPFERLRTGDDSRVGLRWPNQSFIQFNALTELEVLPPNHRDDQSGLHLIRGMLSFFHRDGPGHIRVITRGAVAGVEGTEFILAVDDAQRTTVSVIDGKVGFGNARATLLLTNGQQAFVDLGASPVRTAGFIVNNILQWCLYYPAILDLEDLTFRQQERDTLEDSLKAYRSGDALAALAKYPPTEQSPSEDVRLYRAALLLSVGQIGQAETLLGSLAARHTSGRSQRLDGAIRQLISVVKRQSKAAIPNPQLATEFLAQSYYEQSQAIPDVSLRTALKLATWATTLSPRFGFAWERVAELDFSLGFNRAAIDALDTSIALAPRNPEALALKGFVLAAQNQTTTAIEWFDRALFVDPSLGNSWLGRGLCRIRRGDAAAGREDLLVAAALEPQRAELRSYLGKAYASTGDYLRAYAELRLAKRLDPNDPTAWLYNALLDEQDNQINNAIKDLEKSGSLNENRNVYRSRLLLDQDRAVRSANLAEIYGDAGMSQVSLEEALRAVNYDYTDYSAHLFLANTYRQLVDPNEIALRYETATENEYLLANLLSPAAAGTMSPGVAQQEYFQLFQRDAPQIISDTEYLSRGAWNESAVQYGIQGNSSYNLEEDIHSDPGQYANNDFRYGQLTLTMKQQITPQDNIYLQAVGYDAHGGDLHQYYTPSMASPDFRFKETQEPTLVMGYNHDRGPGIHTLLLLARIDDTYSFTNSAQPTLVAFRPEGNPGTIPGVQDLTSVQGINMRQSFTNQLAIYSGELQQIWETSAHTTIAGARLQYGTFQTRDLQDLPSKLVFLFPSPPSPASQQDVKTQFGRASLYGYHEWQIIEPLRLFGGLTYDWMRFPANYQTAPISQQEESTSQISPKGGLLWNPLPGTTIGLAIIRSLGGASVDQSYQLEPSQVAGFLQSFRSLIPESVAAESPAAKFDAYGISLEQRFSTRTYVEVYGDILGSQVRELVGAFNVFPPQTTYALPGALHEDLNYQEKTLQFSANQILGENLSIGASYQISQVFLNNDFPDVPNGIPVSNFEPHQQTRAILRQAQLFAGFNAASGIFMRSEMLWNGQNNAGYTPNLPADAFWQLNAMVGYRFCHRKAELRVGVLNILSQDYNLNPLNLHQELPRQRTLTMALRLNF